MEAGVLFGRGRAHDPPEHQATELEAHIAARLGMVVDEIDLIEFLHGDPQRALSHLPRGAGRCWTVRGWMSIRDYEVLHEAMSARGDRLAVTPHQLAEASFAAVCRGLLDGRGDPLRGLVVRASVPLATLRLAPEGRDVVDEHRIFFWKGRPVAHAPHYDVDAAPCEVDRFAHLGEVVASPFFAADVARRTDGGWTLIELTDGGSSGLPPRMDPWSLYEAMCEDPP